MRLQPLLALPLARRLLRVVHRVDLLHQRRLPPLVGLEHDRALRAPALRRLFTIEQLRYRSHEWAWLSNAAFFVASAFIIGSLLFIIGATVSVWPVGVEDDKLTTYAYFLGGTYFCFGAYIGHFEVINVGCSQRRLLAWPSEAVSASGYWGSGLYFVGAVAFEVAVGFNLLAPVTVRHDPLYHVLLDWLPQCVGGMLFTAAALVEFHHNHDATPEHRVWWLCAFYLLGSVFFWVAASLGLGLAAGGEEGRVLGAVGAVGDGGGTHGVGGGCSAARRGWARRRDSGDGARSRDRRRHRAVVEYTSRRVR